MTYYDYYDGSKLFIFISNRIGLPIDLVNFLIAQIAALCLARLFRKPLRRASSEFRHYACLFIGLVIGYFCFGKQAIHLSVLPMLSYTLLKIVPHHVMGNVVLAASMIYLSCLHLHRQIYHTADYSLDITGPLMVITQRVTSLAYSIQDGFAKKEINANGNNPKQSPSGMCIVEKVPSPLEYFAYTLAFQTLMCGPVVFYSDYIKFIEGARIDGEKAYDGRPEPSPRRAVLYKVGGSVAAALLYLTLSKKYPLTVLRELIDPQSEVSRTWSALGLLWYAYLATLVVRCKYYHAWLLSEAICNNSGMGFNGYDTEGKPKWDKMSNIDVFSFEFAQNFRTAVAAWNKNTNTWLRYVAYERGSKAWRTARVYTLSAVWHGFHPGYYLTFLAGALFTVAARKIRVVTRPVFLEGQYKKLFYDLATFATTRVAMTYATVPFVLLHLAPSLAFYGSFGRSKDGCYKLWKVYFDERSKEKGIWYKTVNSEPPKILWFSEEQTVVSHEYAPAFRAHPIECVRTYDESCRLAKLKLYYSLHVLALGALLLPERPRCWPRAALLTAGSPALLTAGSPALLTAGSPALLTAGSATSDKDATDKNTNGGTKAA